MHEGQRLIITNARFAGGPAPGEPGWVDEDKAAMLVARGSARYADTLSGRFGQIEPHAGAHLLIIDDPVREELTEVQGPVDLEVEVDPDELVLEEIEFDDDGFVVEHTGSPSGELD